MTCSICNFGKLARLAIGLVALSCISEMGGSRANSSNASGTQATQERVFEKVVIASDHRGVEMKAKLIEGLKAMGFQVEDMGPDDEKNSVDYPDFAKKVANCVQKGQKKGKKCFGILICMSGVGMTISVNRYKDVRGVWCDREELAILSRQHNDANVMCFASKFVDVRMALELVDVFTKTQFEGGRHAARVKKIDKNMKK